MREGRQRAVGRVLQDEGVSKGLGSFGSADTHRLELLKLGTKVNYLLQSRRAFLAFS